MLKGEKSIVSRQDDGGRFLMEQLVDTYQITPHDSITDIESRNDFKKLDLSSAQKMQIGGVISQMPAIAATGALGGAYTITFPNGIPGSCRLMQYSDGGFGTPVMGERGIVGHASLHELSSQAAVLGALNAISVASGQYFLAQINNELKIMNQGIDKILDFLYSDKKAELIAELSFVKQAYQNYNSVMEHDAQRVATISSLQKAKKVAMKDIEFYISDLDSAVRRCSDLQKTVDDAMKTKDCLTLSMQLYMMSSLLEVYYSQNFDSDYIHHIKDDTIIYLAKCENRMRISFGALENKVHSFKETVMKKINKAALENQVGNIVNSFADGEESEMRRSFRQALKMTEQKAEYYIQGESVYIKTA